MDRQPINSLDELGIVFRHGYQTRPVPSIVQVLWFQLDAQISGLSCPPSSTYFWVEQSSGPVAALKFDHLAHHPDEMIRFFVGTELGNCAGETMVDWLQKQWLLPPNFYLDRVKAALISPQSLFLWDVIKNFFVLLLGRSSIPASLARRLEAALQKIPEAPLIERYSIDSDFERNASSALPDEVMEFLPFAQQFQEKLASDVTALFDYYAKSLNVRTHTLENYNIARSWTAMQRRNRIQAIEICPWLFPEFGLRIGGPDFFLPPAPDAEEWVPRVCEAIDKGQPLIPLLATRYKVQKHTLRYAQRFFKHRHRSSELAPAALWLLDGIKPDNRPIDLAGMDFLHTAIDWIAFWQLNVERVYVETLAETLFIDGVNGFRQLIARWCPSHNPENPLADVSDFLAVYADRTGQGRYSSGLMSELVKGWIRELGLISLLAESERWHVESLTREQLVIDIAWSPIFSEPLAVGHLIAHELYDYEMFVEEGIAMRHCIASYAWRCADRSSVAFSLRSHSGKRCSTVLLKMRSPDRLAIEQHRGFANSAPEQDCIEAVDALIDALIETNSDALQQIRSSFLATLMHPA